MTAQDLVKGNPGALRFFVEANADYPHMAFVFAKAMEYGITGARLHMLWNDCCNRDTGLALKVLEICSEEKLIRYINYEGGRGTPLTKEDLYG